MKIPTIKGVIDRRILANFRIKPEVVARILPAPFRPKLAHGWAMGGICLIRLTRIRPRFVPLPWGIGSENAAHRIAVEWDTQDGCQQGVYIPRRDTSSWLNTWAGGTLFPGVHHHASFKIAESAEHYSVTMKSDDSGATVHVSGKMTQEFPRTSVFSCLADASKFFEAGSLGYSVTKQQGRFDGIELCCDNWNVESLEVDGIQSSYFEQQSLFPLGTVEFDCALLMRNIHHEWHGREDLCCTKSVVT